MNRVVLMADFDRESMLEMFSFEMGQLLEQLEQTLLQSESGYTSEQINEIFRIMHTIKGSAAMMAFDTISTTAHSIEDLFFYLREESPTKLDYEKLTDIVLEAMDFIKAELVKVEDKAPVDGNTTAILGKIKELLAKIKEDNGAAPAGGAKAQAGQASGAAAASSPAEAVKPGFKRYASKVVFNEQCEMENIRAYTLVHNLEGLVEEVSHDPADVLEEETAEVIRKKGFSINFISAKSKEELLEVFEKTPYLKEYRLDEVNGAKPRAGGASYEAKVKFLESSEMENVRAYALVHRLHEIASKLEHTPSDLMDESSLEEVRQSGVVITMETELGYEELDELINNTAYVKEVKLMAVNKEAKAAPAQVEAASPVPAPAETAAAEAKPAAAAPKDEGEKPADDAAVKKGQTQHVISVNVSKLDQLVKLMGELVISEAMVTQNPDLEGLELENFHKETRQLNKIIKDLQDIVLTMRMVPLSTTFFKMHRIVRDMCRQLGKDVSLEIVGEETEVDKNIIEHISDPIMHIIRNSVDHGVELPGVRVANGKPSKGTVTLEATNTGGDVLIIIRDDGGGLDRDRILEKAKNNGLLRKPESEYTDREIHQFIFLPGFSTNEKVTSYSGRGVGMDVVSTNLDIVGGSVSVESKPGEGSVFTLKIPLTLAIIDGMTITMGGANYTLPIMSIEQSFRVQDPADVFTDPSGNEMISTRGKFYNIVRLHDFFGVDTAVKNVEEAIFIMLENGDQSICLMADDLVGEQQVVVKSIPDYFKKVRGINGCTLLGNGDISLILDVAGFFDN